MAQQAKIQWTRNADGSQGMTWNPIGGCEKCSPGCKNCYAIRQAHRMAGNPNEKIASRYKGLTVIQGGAPNWTGKTFIDEEVLLAPILREKPTTYFISLSDLFYEWRTDEDIDRVFAVIALTRRHTFQILTKYAVRMVEYFKDPDVRDRIRTEMWLLVDGIMDPNVTDLDEIWPVPNVWLGVSVENQQYADERTELLRRTPAALRFISYEPALSAVNFDLTGIDWLIVGGESGPGARPCDIALVRQTIAQCQAAGVPCFVKQLGAKPTIELCANPAAEWPDAAFETLPYSRIGLTLMDRKGGTMDEWPSDLRVREMPNV